MKRENIIGGTALVYWNASLFHSIPSLISLSAVKVSELMVLKLFHILPSLSFWQAVHWWESETLNSSLCESIPLPSQISGMKLTSVAAKYVRLITNERYKVRLCPSIYPLHFQPSFSLGEFLPSIIFWTRIRLYIKPRLSSSSAFVIKCWAVQAAIISACLCSGFIFVLHFLLHRPKVCTV